MYDKIGIEYGVVVGIDHFLLCVGFYDAALYGRFEGLERIGIMGVVPPMRANGMQDEQFLGRRVVQRFFVIGQ